MSVEIHTRLCAVHRATSCQSQAFHRDDYETTAARVYIILFPDETWSNIESDNNVEISLTTSLANLHQQLCVDTRN